MKNFTTKLKSKNFINFFGIIFIFLIWLILSNVYNNSLIVPKIDKVFIAFIEILGTARVYELIFKLIINILLVISISFLIATTLAVFSYKYEKFYYFISPLITVLKTIPIVAIIILLIISLMDLAPYVATCFVIIPIIFEGIFSTLKQIDSNITDDLRTVTDINLIVILKFFIPLIMPNILTSLIQSFGLGLKVMVMTEYTSPRNNTFGAEIRRYYDNNDMESVYAIVLIVILLSFVTDKIIKMARKKTLNEK